MLVERLRGWAMRLRRDIVALWIVARSPATPLVAKLVAGAVAAYALSPIDFIPDFIPVLGLLDDLIIVPAGMVLALRLVPAAQLAAARAEAGSAAERPVSRIAAVVIVASWTALGVAGFFWWR